MAMCFYNFTIIIVREFITFYDKSNVMLNFALVPLSTKESERSRCLASANESSELQKDRKRLLNFSSIFFNILQ